MKTIFTTLEGIMVDVDKIVIIGDLHPKVNSDIIGPYRESYWYTPITPAGTSNNILLQLTGWNSVGFNIYDGVEVVDRKRDVLKMIAESEYNRLITMWKAS